MKVLCIYLVATLILSISIDVDAFCLSSLAYHASAASLATGFGHVDTSAVCVYGPNPKLSDECPMSCMTLLLSVWGDCYCRNPDYIPAQIGFVDKHVKGKTVKDIYEFILQPEETLLTLGIQGVTCKTWLNDYLEDVYCLD